MWWTISAPKFYDFLLIGGGRSWKLSLHEHAHVDMYSHTFE